MLENRANAGEDGEKRERREEAKLKISQMLEQSSTRSSRVSLPRIGHKKGPSSGVGSKAGNRAGGGSRTSRREGGA